MRMLAVHRSTLVLGTLVLAATACCAQAPLQPVKPIGTVAAADGNVTNAPSPEAVNGRIVLNGSATVTARDHTAPIALGRGGELRVCQGTGVHLAESPDESLLLGLDRGAFEIKTDARAGDVVMTPDLRFTLSEAAPLDLEMRVTSAGDTCVDNRGHHAPTLKISDSFGESTYELKPGQHVTFEHGSLKEVVDKETVSCGCPPDDLKRGSLADAMVAGGGKRLTPAEKSAADHPFPAAVSDGLVAPSQVPPQAPNVTHVQVAATLAYDPNAAPAPASAPAIVQPAPVPAPAQESGSRFGAIGRFFKRLFAR
jgi:hypothetical protein